MPLFAVDLDEQITMHEQPLTRFEPMPTTGLTVDPQRGLGGPARTDHDQDALTFSGPCNQSTSIGMTQSLGHRRNHQPSPFEEGAHHHRPAIACHPPHDGTTFECNPRFGRGQRTEIPWAIIGFDNRDPLASR